MSTARELGLTPDLVSVFRFCQVELYWDWQRVITRFPDGTEAHAAPHDTAEYHCHAIEKTGIDSPILYCVEHDLTHVLVGEIQDRPSHVLWAVAHGYPTETPACELEERASQELHKFLTATVWPQRCGELRDYALSKILVTC